MIFFYQGKRKLKKYIKKTVNRQSFFNEKYFTLCRLYDEYATFLTIAQMQ